jgi:hypothetical protein
MKTAVLNNALARNLVLRPLFELGKRVYQRSGKTPWASYFAFRQLYFQTQGAHNQKQVDALRQAAPPVALDSSDGLLGEGPAWQEELPRVAAALHRDGYHVFERRLPLLQCEQLRELSLKLPARLTPRAAGAPARALFDDQRPLATRYDFDELQYLAHPVIQQLLCDQSLISLAQTYFGAVPINDLMAFWWSAPQRKASSEAAQLFHFDLDRQKFLKIFFYLTDVGPENGPHCYVRGSHTRKPRQFYADRRFGDHEVAQAFPAEDIREVHGPVGTIVAGDTLCLHKGKPLVSGARLIFQMEFTLSLFGQTYETLPVGSEMALLRERMARYPAVYSRFKPA